MNGDEVRCASRLAEDVRRVRSFAATVLTRGGYRVLGAVDGQEATDLLKEHDSAIDLCLLDMEMPKRSGPGIREVLDRRGGPGDD